MAAIFPNSTIILLKGIPLTNSYKHTVDYDNATAQYNDFIRFEYTRYNEYTYVRNGVIRVQGSIGNLYDVNYIMFKNTSYLDKWFYAFATTDYVNNEVVQITYEIDIMQTWLFNFTMLPCYIERQTIAHDDIFSSLTEEELETGDYIVKRIEHPNIFDSDHIYPVIGVSRKISDTTGDFVISPNTLYGLNTMETFYVMRYNNDDYDEWRRFYNYYRANGNTDDIIEMTLIPGVFLRREDFKADSQGFYYLKNSQNGDNIYSYWLGIDKITGGESIGNYIPRNKKLYQAPYFNISITDCEGNSCSYFPQLFRTEYNEFYDENLTNDKYWFRIQMAVGSMPQPIVRPLYYRVNNPDIPFNAGEFFIGCAYGPQPLMTDSYAAWLAMNNAQLQNQFNIATTTKNYMARSNANNTAIANNNAMSALYNSKVEDILKKYGLQNAPGPNAFGLSATGLLSAVGNVPMVSGITDAISDAYNSSAIGYATKGVVKVAEDVTKALLGTNIGDAIKDISYLGNQPSAIAGISAHNAAINAENAEIAETYGNKANELAIKGVQAKITDAQAISPSVRGISNNNMLSAFRYKGITVIISCLHETYARCIDCYFDMYGYKVNAIGEINTKSRRFWNYVQTIGANISSRSPIPQNVQAAIRNMYDSGITFWHNNLDNVGDYTLYNEEVQ